MFCIRNYFKGRYYKCCNKDLTAAFIPAFHINNFEKTASMQIITDHEAFNIPFDITEYKEAGNSVMLGRCLFSDKGIKLGISEDNLNVYGTLKFTSHIPIRYDIMGPFKYVPFMQCRHSVMSMRHIINGYLFINGRRYDFKNGLGYIEGDRGYSFPERYIWTQSFFKGGSLMLSVADIPMGFHFNGIIGAVTINGREYRIATYLGATVKYIGRNSVTVTQGQYQLTAKLIKNNSYPLNAPENGRMSRTIHESASCKAYYRFSFKDRPLCEFISSRASFEYEF
ncbi:hypothetical protein Osc1_17750 [Hominimerdicola sp. 21CYCFAH17_S]